MSRHGLFNKIPKGMMERRLHNNHVIYSYPNREQAKEAFDAMGELEDFMETYHFNSIPEFVKMLIDSETATMMERLKKQKMPSGVH